MKVKVNCTSIMPYVLLAVGFCVAGAGEDLGSHALKSTGVALALCAVVIVGGRAAKWLMEHSQ